MSQAIDLARVTSMVSAVCKPRAHAVLTAAELAALLELVVVTNATPSDYLLLSDPIATQQALYKLGLAIDEACQSTEQTGEPFFLSMGTEKTFCK